MSSAPCLSHLRPQTGGYVICWPRESVPGDASSTSRTFVTNAFGLKGLPRNAAPGTSPTFVARTSSA